MRKIVFLISFLLSIASTVGANPFLTLGYHYLNVPGNEALGLEPATKPYMNFDAGYLFKSNWHIGFRYDHLSLEDYQKDSKNVRIIAVIPALGAGYTFKPTDRWHIWLSIWPGYAVSTRYRLGIDDYKGRNWTIAITSSAFYKLTGKFSIGTEIGWRNLLISLKGSESAPALLDDQLDLSGFFYGISIKHIF